MSKINITLQKKKESDWLVVIIFFLNEKKKKKKKTLQTYYNLRGGAHDAMVIIQENGNGNQNSNPEKAAYIWHSTNTLEKDMNSFILHSAMGNSLVRLGSLTLLWQFGQEENFRIQTF